MLEIKKREGSARLSIKEGAVSSISSSIRDTYIPQFALALKAHAFSIGVLSALAGLIEPVSEYISNFLMRRNSRKSLILITVSLQVIILLGISLLGLLAWKGIASNYHVAILIAAYVLLAISIGIGYPPWFSWMGDLIPEKQRGKYFGSRQRVAQTASLIIIPLGFLLDASETRGLAVLGFSLMFLIAALTRLISLFLLNRQYHPSFKLKRSSFFSFISFIRYPSTVSKFAIYNAFFNLAIAVASPFYVVYMRESLQFNYLTITLISLSSAVFFILFSPMAGRFSDKYGNVKLFTISAILLSLNPLIWLFIKSPLLLIIIPQLIVGLSNAALSISVTNFMYNMVSPQHRSLCISYTNVLAGIGVFFGSLLGGLLISKVSFINPYLFVFLVAGILRLLISVKFIASLKEEEHVKSLPKLSILHPLRSIESEVLLIRRLSKPQ